MTTSTKSLLALGFIAGSISIIGSQDLYAGRNGSKSVLSEHKYYSIAKDCYLGKHSGV